MIKKITFYEPKTEKLHIYSKFDLPRIGNVLLATIMRDIGYECNAYYLKTSDFLARNVKPDVLCLSTITTTAPAAYRIADLYRSQGTTVIIGGPHVSALPEEALHHADFAVMGEGEIPLPALLEVIKDAESFHTPEIYAKLETVPGLAWLKYGEVQKNSLPQPIEDLDALPFPDFKLLDTGGVSPTGIGFKPTIPMQTSRGCPFDCKFCSVTAMFGKKFRFRSIQSVIDEMKQYDPKKHVIFFYDDNFSANKRRTKELLLAMKAHREEFGGNFEWSTQVRVDIAKDPEILDLLKETGCLTLYIGFESVDPAALKEMKKHQSVADIEWAIKQIHKRGIHIHGMFVMGFDSDTKESVNATVKFAIKHRIGSAQFLILTPLPGTEFYYEIINSDRWIDNAWEEYDTHHVKFVPKNFSLWELQRMQIKAHGKFYRYRNVFNKLFHGRVREFLIGLYANHLNRQWQVWERQYINTLKRISGEERYHMHPLIKIPTSSTS